MCYVDYYTRSHLQMEESQIISLQVERTLLIILIENLNKFSDFVMKFQYFLNSNRILSICF